MKRCTSPSWFPLQVVGPLGDGLSTQPPDALRQIPTPDLAPGWDPGSVVLGVVTCLEGGLHEGVLNGLCDSASWTYLHTLTCTHTHAQDKHMHPLTPPSPFP
ncbi:hypothetical protein ILYODFUR_033771, partial [Ilyodon furcidens]